MKKKLKAFDMACTVKDPKARKALLESAGCEPKYWSKGRHSVIAVQKTALLRNLSEGMDKTLEDDILTKVLSKAVGDIGTEHMKVKANGTGFIASFQGSKQAIDQPFKSLGGGVNWLMALHSAEKAMGWSLYYNCSFSRYLQREMLNQL